MSRRAPPASRRSAHAHHLGDRLPGDVVLGRAEAAADDDGVAARRARSRRRSDDAADVVADAGLVVAVDARPPPAARRSRSSWCRRSDRGGARSRPRRSPPRTRFRPPTRGASSSRTCSARVRSSRPSVEVVLRPGDDGEADGRPRASARRRPRVRARRGAGRRRAPTATSWTRVFSFAGGAGRDRHAARGRRRRDRRSSPISRTAISDDRPASSRSAMAGQRAPSAPSTRNLSASGSRKAPERVVPCRRATWPSRPSEPASTVQSDQSSHDDGPVSPIRTANAGAATTRTS